MVIDFHTHIFPDVIAEKTIKALEKVGNTKAYTDGTLHGLKRSMMEHNIDIAVVLPVVTKPSQFDTVNTFAAEITNKGGIISFGGIHPDSDDYKEKLEKIKSLGLLGIKLHPDYQDMYIEDEKYVRLIQYAVELELIVILHAGLDIGLPEPIHCSPERAAKMLSQIDDPKARIILAHMGGFDQWDLVEEYLVGQNVWFDTSYSLGKMSDEQFVRIVKNHGADRVLFATDLPWAGQKETLEHIKGLDFSEEELDRILWRNAEGLLGL